jgi:hypothetical protein
MDASEILDGQTIVLKRGRMNGLGFEPCFNSFFDFYLSPKYVDPPLLQLEDVTFFLFLRKNLNDRDPSWKMPSFRQMMRRLHISQRRITAMLGRLEKAQLVKKMSGIREAGENVRNEYILSDPIPTLEEFLTVASEGMFGVLPKEGCMQKAYTVYAEEIHPPVCEKHTLKQTLKTETGGDGIWESVLRQLQISTPQGTFGAFLQGTALSVIEEGIATVTTNRPHACEWLQTQMAPRIKKALTTELAARGEKTTVAEVRFVVKSE